MQVKDPYLRIALITALRVLHMVDRDEVEQGMDIDLDELDRSIETIEKALKPRKGDLIGKTGTVPRNR